MMKEVEFSEIRVGVWEYDDDVIKNLLKELFSSRVVVFDDNDVDCDSAVIVASEKVSSILGVDIDIGINLEKVKRALESEKEDLMDLLVGLVCLRYLEKKEIKRIKKFL